MVTTRKPCFAQVGEELFRVREAVFVPGKDPVAVHVVDVKEDHIARDVPLPELPRDLAYFFLGFVAPAALLVAERPLGRHGDAAGKLSVAVEHLFRGRSAEHVVDDITALGAVVSAVPILFRQVDLDAVSVIEEEAVGHAVREREREGYRSVHVVEGGRVSARRVPRSRRPGRSRSYPARSSARRNRSTVRLSHVSCTDGPHHRAAP